MARGNFGKPVSERGLNSSVEHHGQHYHVQTQCSNRGAPTIESLVFQGGQALVRITASYDEVAERLGFTGDDGRFLLEHQHTDLIRKIRHGMLRDDDGEGDGRAPAVPRSVPVGPVSPNLSGKNGSEVEVVESSDPTEEQLLRELDAAIETVWTEGVGRTATMVSADGRSGERVRRQEARAANHSSGRASRDGGGARGVGSSGKDGRASVGEKSSVGVSLRAAGARRETSGNGDRSPAHEVSSAGDGVRAARAWGQALHKDERSRGHESLLHHASSLRAGASGDPALAGDPAIEGEVSSIDSRWGASAGVPGAGAVTATHSNGMVQVGRSFRSWRRLVIRVRLPF